MQCGDVTRAQQNTSRSWWPAGFQTPMMWSGSPSEWSGGACDACRPPSLLLFPVPLRARDALNVLRNTHKVSTMVIKDKDWATLKLQSRDRESETKWESHLIYDLMTSWPHNLMTSWPHEPVNLMTYEPMNLWPCDHVTSWCPSVQRSELCVTTTLRILLRTWGESEIFISGDPFSLIYFCSLSSTCDIFFLLDFNLVQILGFTPWKRNPLLFTDGTIILANLETWN